MWVIVSSRCIKWQSCPGRPAPPFLSPAVRRPVSSEQPPQHWGDILCLFWVLRVHEINSFIPNSSVFIFLMLPALYRMICKNSKSFLCKNNLNVQNVKLFSNFFFNIFGFFMPFWWEWRLALYILGDYPVIKNLSGLNDLNNLNGLNDLYSLISTKNPFFLK